MPDPAEASARVSKEMAEQVLAAQPFSRLLGVELAEFTSGSASLWLRVRRDHLQQQGRVHGGVLAYLVDNAATFAGGSVLGPDVVTGGLDVEYVTAARGPVLVAHARVDHATATTAFCSVTVVESDAVTTGRGEAGIVALGRGRVRTLRRDGAAR